VGPLVAAFDTLFAMGRVLRSSIAEDTKVVKYDLEGVGFDDDPKGERSEVKPGQETLGPLGMYGRPLEASTEQDQWSEYLAVRTSDGLLAFAFRDRRILDVIAKGSSGDVPKVGQLLWGGYGGGLMTFEYQLDELRDQFTLYIPYERNGSGVPTKAHMLQVGKDGSGAPFIGLISGEGPRLTMVGTEGVLSNKDGSQRVEVLDDGVNVVGTLKAAGAADLGGPTSEALAKYASLAAYVTALEVQVQAITALLGVPGPPAPVMTLPALAATGATEAAAAAIFLAPATGGTLFTKGA
jgi:hypothetical protein